MVPFSLSLSAPSLIPSLPSYFLPSCLLEMERGWEGWIQGKWGQRFKAPGRWMGQDKPQVPGPWLWPWKHHSQLVSNIHSPKCLCDQEAQFPFSEIHPKALWGLHNNVWVRGYLWAISSGKSFRFFFFFFLWSREGKWLAECHTQQGSASQTGPCLLLCYFRGGPEGQRWSASWFADGEMEVLADPTFSIQTLLIIQDKLKCHFLVKSPLVFCLGQSLPKLNFTPLPTRALPLSLSWLTSCNNTCVYNVARPQRHQSLQGRRLRYGWKTKHDPN